MAWIWNNTKRLFKRKLFWLIVIIIIIGIVVISRLGGDSKIEYVTENVIKNTLVQTVSETGSVQATTEIDLNFKSTGTIVKINVAEGDEVSQSDILARLDAGSLEIQIRQAQANLDIARANLNRLLAGASFEDIKVTEETVNNARIAWENAKTDHEVLLNKLEADLKIFQEAAITAQTALDNSENTYSQSVADARQILITTIRSKANFANTSLDFIDYQFVNIGNVSDQQAGTNTITYYRFGLEKLADLNDLIDKSDQSLTESEISQASNLAITLLEDINISLNSLFNAISSAVIDARFSQTLVDNSKALVKAEQISNSINLSALQTADQAYKTAQLTFTSSLDAAAANLNTAQANLDAALASKNSQIAVSSSAGDSALGFYNLAKAQLDLKTAPARNFDIAYNQAQIDQAQAALDLVVSNLDDFMITAPTDGIIIFVNYDVGEQIGFGITDITEAAKSVISMLGKGEFEIEVDVPESNIIKVKVGNNVNITLDAYGDDFMFEGKVVFVDLAETNIRDVVYYKVTLEMNPYDLEIKPGMTANVDIITDIKEDVLIVPTRSVKETADGRKYVEILSLGKPKQVDVVTGLRGDEGIEIISGVSEGQKVIIYKREK